MQRLAATGAAVVTQPSFIGRMGDGFAAALGPERAERLYPARSLRVRGVRLVGSSDPPAGDLSPFQSMADARQRRAPSGAVITRGTTGPLSGEFSLRDKMKKYAIIHRVKKRVSVLAPRAHNLGPARTGLAASGVRLPGNWQDYVLY